ncbi:MAG: class I SAM-dependent methyltransferase [Verrucomicrobiota bacterium]|jgi:predicted O-methyltransferase YrrM
MNLLRALLRKTAAPAEPTVEEVLSPLDNPFRTALLSMYRNELQLGYDGQRHSLDTKTRVAPQQGMWLYKLYCESKPKSSLEVGMAYGFSTIFFLAALAKNGSGSHIAIDPFQKSLWHGIGLQKIIETRSEGVTRFMEDYSFHAVTDLSRAGRTFEFIFIDGNHRFDDVLVDFTLCARLCPIGGLIIFDDLWMPSVQMVISFIHSNRSDFVEIPSPISNIAMFRRNSADDRKWNHFTKFDVAR